MNRPPTLSKAANALEGKRIMVAGDMLVDEYVFGNTERVSREARIRDAVEAEAQWPRAIDDPAGGKSKRLRHGAPPVSGSPGLALPKISCVRVSRRTLNQRLHPAL